MYGTNMMMIGDDEEGDSAKEQQPEEGLPRVR
jgi:hypothetical protein